MREFRETRKGILTKIDELDSDTTLLAFLFGDSYIEIPFYGQVDENLDYEEAVFK